MFPATEARFRYQVMSGKKQQLNSCVVTARKNISYFQFECKKQNKTRAWLRRRRWCMSWLPVSRWPQRKPSPAPSPLYDSRTVNRQTAQSDSQRSLQTVTRRNNISEPQVLYRNTTQYSVLTHWGGDKKTNKQTKISLKHANNLYKTSLIFVRKIW